MPRTSGSVSNLWRYFLICVSLSSGFGLTTTLMGCNNRKSEWVSLHIRVCMERGEEGVYVRIGEAQDRAHAVLLKPMSGLRGLAHTHTYTNANHFFISLSPPRNPLSSRSLETSSLSMSCRPHRKLHCCTNQGRHGILTL